MEKPTPREILDDLARVRQKLGRLPNRLEYEREGKVPGIIVTETFGSFFLMVQAYHRANPFQKKSKEQKRLEAFEHLKREVEEKSKILVAPPPLYSSILVIGDLHVPYQHPDAIPWLIALSGKYKFDLAISAGDELDYHAISFHDSDPDILSAGHELEAAIKIFQPLYAAFPSMLIADSNHGSLVYRKAKHHGLPARCIRGYRDILEAPLGWEWQFEIRVQMSNGQKLVVHHSYPGSVLLNSQRLGENLICGHKHNLFSLEYWGNGERDFFAGQTGCLIEEKALAFAYGKNNILRPRLGSIAILGGVPRLLPMFLDRNGRWNGVLP